MGKDLEVIVNDFGMRTADFGFVIIEELSVVSGELD